MKALRLLFSLSAAVAALGVGAYAGGAFAPAQAAASTRPARVSDEQPYDNPPEGGEIAVGDALSVNGQPMQLSIFFTSDGPERVIGFYAEAFRARGLTPIVGGAHVSAFDPHDGWQRFINAVPQAGGQTMVMIGATNPRRPPRLVDGAAHAGFPVPAENRGFLGYLSEDVGTKAEIGQFMTALSVEEVAAYYRKELLARGWAQRDASESMLTFARGGEMITVSMQALDAKQGAAVFVNRTEGLK